ncbi:hypothetical protein [Lacrimispora xylanisolvens]|uniref:hypothetical protein n=1 Tax=Lacrimispora xylanisolvens TaxID=384636 RepID=UPI002402BA5E
MEVKEVFEIAGAVLASLGGGAAIVFGLSSWLGKVWANRILENEKAEHIKDLEQYKRELSEELEKVKSLNDKALYVSKAQYDNEFRIYTEIWSALHEVIIFSKRLYPFYESRPEDEAKYYRYQQGKYDNFVEKYNSYSMLIDKYAPFYKKEFYDSFKEVRNWCHSLGSKFSIYELEFDTKETKPKDVCMEIYFDIPESLDRIEDELQGKIREYLLGLQLNL